MALQRISPWAEYAEKFSASAQAQRALRNRLGRRFREAQQEAYASWAAWDEAMGDEAEGEEIRVTPMSNLRMAAATSKSDLEETSEPIIFAEVTLDEATYQFAEQLGGEVLLSGPMLADATHIHFGREQYALLPTDTPTWYQIEDIGRADVSDYLVDYQQAPTENPIWIGPPE